MRSEVRILSGAFTLSIEYSMIITVFPAGPIETNAYLLVCEETKKAWIIDAPLQVTDEIAAEIELEKFKLEKIILTHSHWDHIADIAEMKKRFPVPVLVHQNDAPNVEKPGSDGLPLYFEIEGVTPNEILLGGETLSLGNMEVHVIHTAGHSPGGICLHIPEQNTLISGDTLFRGSMGRVDLPTSDPDKMWDSLLLLSKLPADTKVYPGHGGSTTIGAESWMKDAKQRFS